MPTYVYECDSCSHTFEEFQSITAAPLKKCPTCSENKLRRVIGPGAAVIFKGSGFYQTDYRSSSYKKAAKADAEAAKKPAESSGSSASDSKTPAAT
jgi:putative FmdB family regulatory protein